MLSKGSDSRTDCEYLSLAKVKIAARATVRFGAISLSSQIPRFTKFSNPSHTFKDTNTRFLLGNRSRFPIIFFTDMPRN